MIKTGIVSVTFRKKTADEIIEITKKADLAAIEWGGIFMYHPMICKMLKR